MSLRRIKRIYATCDRCEEEAEVGYFEDSWQNLESMLRYRDWQIGKSVLCPNCRTRPKVAR